MTEQSSFIVMIAPSKGLADSAETRENHLEKQRDSVVTKSSEPTSMTSEHNLEQALEQPPSFLQFPPEIRDLIYSFLLIANGEPRAFTLHYFAYRFPCAFLRTCRLIHAEASSYFYSRNTYGFTVDPWFCSGFPSACVPSYCHHITRYSITIRTGMTSYAEHDVRAICEWLAAVPRIKSLEIHGTFRSPFESWEPDARIDEEKARQQLEILRPFSLLTGNLDEVIVGKFINPEGKDDRAYRFLKEVMYSPDLKWSYPYPQFQYKD